MNLFLGIIIVILSSALYMLGGQKNNWFRWGMGLPIGILSVITTNVVLPYKLLTIVLCGVTYWFATSWFPYGMNSWLNFAGEKGKFFICGFVLGLASMPVLHLLSILSGIVSGFGFLVLKVLDDKNLVKNPYQELGRGAMAFLLFLWR